MKAQLLPDLSYFSNQLDIPISDLVRIKRKHNTPLQGNGMVVILFNQFQSLWQQQYLKFLLGGAERFLTGHLQPPISFFIPRHVAEIKTADLRVPLARITTEKKHILHDHMAGRKEYRIPEPLQFILIKAFPILFDHVPFKTGKVGFRHPLVQKGDTDQLFQALHVLHDRIVGARPLPLVGGT